MKSEDVAKLAGVSRSTVSRVVNNYRNVPEETREKVMKVIEAFGYEPNTSARVLAGKGLNTIGLFIVSIADDSNPNRIYQNNYFAPFVDTVIDVANAQGYYVLVNTVYSLQEYQKVKQAFLQKRVDCGIIVGTQADTEVILDIARQGYPLVIIDFDIEEARNKVKEATKLTLINSMDYQGTITALSYLYDLGHREIAMLAGRMNTYSGRQRYKAYEEFMQNHGLSIRKEFILKGEFIKKKAYQEVKKLIKTYPLPSAIISSNDDMAISAMEALAEEGIQVPEDVSVIGFDDIPVAAQIHPALTTVRVPVYQMAKKAVEQLILVVETGSESLNVYSFPTQLIARKTCAQKQDIQDS